MTQTSFVKTLVFLSASVIILAGCTQNAVTNTSTNGESKSDDQMTETQLEDTSEQPTIGASTKTQDLKQELDDTDIQQEDFSDL